MAKMKLKMFIWTDFYSDYTEGLAFAIAETEEEARAMIEKEMGSDAIKGRNWGKLEVRAIGKMAYCVAGGA